MKTRVLGHSDADQTAQGMQHDDLIAKVAVGAYYKAKARGFAPGHELEDWLMAEAEIISKERHPMRLGLKATLVPNVQVDLNITE